MRALQCLPLALLFLTSAVPTKAQEGAAEASEVRVVVREGAPLTVECRLRVEQPVEWRHDGGPVAADLHAGEAASGGRLKARLHAGAARPAHAGLYSCGRDAWQRVRVVVQPAPAPAVMAAPPGGATTEAAAAAEPGDLLPVTEIPKELFVFDIARQFSLNCTKLAPAEPNTIVWKKNGTEIEKWKDLENRYELKENGVVFHLNSRTYEDDFGLYTCSSPSKMKGEAHAWQVEARPHAKLPPDSNVVEGQKIKLQCKLIGKPYPAVTWTFRNGSEETNATDVKLALGDRVVLQTTEQGVENGELVLEAAQRSDAGVYTCTPKDGVAASTRLRVKDMYAALWPFLGICAEVFVLCVIILLYEKRRTKPELDDSDTDNHDQKKS